jgi:L-iditol 2-dehydrogenase
MPKEGVEQGLLIPVPDDMSDAVATLVEPLSCCVNGMDYLPLGDMDHVVIMSAGIIAVLNGLVARARGAKNITIMNRSQGRLDLINRLGLPFDNLVNTSQHDPVKWVKENTRGGADGVVVAASAKELVPVGVQMLGMGGHLSVFAGFAKNDPMEPLDLNLIHYRELNIHGASGSARSHYFDALDLLKSDLIDWESIITHRFALGDFVEAFETQKNPDVDSLKILIQP